MKAVGMPNPEGIQDLVYESAPYHQPAMGDALAGLAA